MGSSGMYSLSVVERDWLLRRSEGLKRVRSLKLQLFWTLAGLVPSVPASATGDRRSLTDDVCLFLMLWPRGLANLTRSLKLNFWLKSERWTAVGDRLSFSLTTFIIRDFWRGVVFFFYYLFVFTQSHNLAVIALLTCEGLQGGMRKTGMHRSITAGTLQKMQAQVRCDASAVL